MKKDNWITDKTHGSLSTVRHMLPPAKERAILLQTPTGSRMMSNPFLPPPSQRRPRPGNFTAFQMTTVLSTLHEASQAS